LTAKNMIEGIIKIGMRVMKDSFLPDKSKEKFILHEISINCKVAPKTVRNWRSGGHIGELRKEKLEVYYKEVKGRAKKNGENRSARGCETRPEGDNTNSINEA
jgi:hypothetical protein